MLYKFPLPTSNNGVKLYALPNEQLGIEVGRPRDATMAYDAEIATGRTVTIRRPDYEAIVSDAVRKVDAEDAIPKAGKPPVRSKDMKTDTLEYDDDATEVISNLLEYLGKYLDPEQMEAVNLIISSGSAPDNDSGEPHNYTATDRRRGRQAADAARRRPMSSATEDRYSAMFPNANRLV